MDLEKIKKQAIQELNQINNLGELNEFRKIYISRTGELTKILRSLKDLPLEQRKKVGQASNKFKQELQNKIQSKQKSISGKKSLQHSTDSHLKLDITAPGKKALIGNLHPITKVLKEITDIFNSMGFEVVEGPDIETEYYNFDALNIPKEHPARDAWDTFWLKPKNLLLRTHTSPMQVRYMEKNNPPFRIVVPGRVFRYENTDASHSHTFYHLEGLVIDKNISVANFKSVISEFFKKLFSKDVEFRLRPDYFPFTEPSFEVDLRGGKFSNWLEIMGAGMVHPNVLDNAGYNPNNWQGFAFGIGIDRIAMIKYGISDIRLLYSNDLRFLKQF